MKATIDRDKKLPQFYVSVFVTDAEFEQIENETNPRELFKGLKSGQVMATALGGLVYAMMLQSEEAEHAAKSKIEVVS